MSLVSTWVHVGNDMYAKNPIILFDEGFICFDDDEPPEIVVQFQDDFSMKGTLDRLSIPYELLDSRIVLHRSDRCFNRDGGFDDFRDSLSMFFKLTGPLPKDLKIQHDGIKHISKIKGDCVLEGSG